MGAAARLLVLQRHTQPASAATASAAAAALLADGAGTVQIDPPLPNEPLGEKEVAEFLDRGLLVLPSILTTEHVAELKQTVDEVMADRAGGAHARYIVEYDMLAGLCAHPPVVERVKQLMGRYGNGREDCCMHHMHVSRHDPGAVGARWHHDYNAVPSVHDRAQLSIHVFYYFARTAKSGTFLLYLAVSSRFIRFGVSVSCSARPTSLAASSSIVYPRGRRWCFTLV